MLVDVTELTDEQRYGLAYEMDKLNEQIEARNATIPAANLQIQAQNLLNSTSIPLRVEEPVYTLPSYAEKVLGERADQAYASLVRYKEQLAVSLFNAADAEKQAQVLSILGVPDVVQE